MQNKTALLAALFAAATLSMHAQTSVPTPQSVAPGYTPPVETTTNASTPSYRAPHAGTWDFYLTTGAWLFNDTAMKADHVRIDRNTYIDGKLKNLSFDDSWYFGFGAGYNITEQLSAHAQFAYTCPDYSAVLYDNTGAPRYDIWGEANICTGELAIRYDLLPGKFRPFIQASIGFMYIDTGIDNGYGYYSHNYHDSWYEYRPTVDRTCFAPGATGGFSYYITNHLFAQASYTANWANTSSTWMFNQRINISVGWNY